MRTTTFLILALIVISGCTSRTDGGARVRPLPNQPASSTSGAIPSGIPLDDGSAPAAQATPYGGTNEVRFPSYPMDQSSGFPVETPKAPNAPQAPVFPNTAQAPVSAPKPTTTQQPTYAPNAPMIPGQSTTTASADKGTYKPSQNQNNAVQSLLDEANSAVKANQLERAATALNRAVRLEPNNASIWYDLAQIRLHQGKYEQSEQLANKSISFAKGNQDLVNKNWRVISSARQAKGDTAGAQEAMRNAQ
ncbi:tetratricopeptide repeat protein [Wohlfahrtiimonas chitiniclastica]|uniref:Tetratricopeptide repeat protein n=1 Tax=Wohlfahrtiimonas chitiniclastica TaxID=400946 RepID=A0AB35BVK3_9GAMM|nr:tetratricopeptide repeat protein [Wohlfahrtiimonas chitiniclastica]MBS7814258.1 tetratricopeptide repeat protein [Wohlfahrtiimonas chitiniclastica]MBS7816798.1 tetratricopeptide repeat protein [Wohlfahrtiimonas chitiniclastica]MBS7822309.1 tetratricopeptide repeat protein [Wohlfahrtiimonas chitiniclastica]MBS7824260.1 tetratricopeptide repeat protein [Wohlfahrtiimonas chitiniclastica]MBS7830371.1 tetratricopeptide repeat protein [Wohlfahrtiimonas chitiniclastica]